MATTSSATDNKRTKAEIEQAFRELGDLFYPRRVWGNCLGDDDNPCPDCGKTDYHKPGCASTDSRSFNGWRSMIKRTKAPEGRCDKEGCDRAATMRIRLNIWGCLYEFDVCARHGKHEGESRDGFRCDDL